MYETFICDEMGHAIYRCMDLSQKKIKSILEEHPEWTVEVKEV